MKKGYIKTNKNELSKKKKDFKVKSIIDSIAFYVYENREKIGKSYQKKKNRIDN